ncbi:class II fumarate hydratase [Flavobacteriaceae bacterium]|jgi:fumarate hydratase class II|nr:class II fumarate hydratase [Flavobacteriaceae bacterium]MDB4196469.1 class II fumarate hydratase [Flavobacteriaceae bacterium]MDB4212872.1 class II fumarate hydratase [Flavobacteriaceae bacterium]MDC0623362.1 class II fumarate hydratase [Flavobacteriaceae bacterium]
MEYRIEKDTLGEVKVPLNNLWGAQTERSRINFKIGPSSSMPIEIIHAFAYLKKAAAITNHEKGILDTEKKDLISLVCDEILNGMHDNQFPLVIWQTGSGTQTNMNVNEVISNRSHQLQGNNLDKGDKFVKPNDDVNKSQSSNDTFPTAISISSYKLIIDKTVPALESLRDEFKNKSSEFENIIKIGRTHLMDATPLTLGQEFSAYVSQLDHGIKALKESLEHLSELALGGTAVGTGLNTPKGYSNRVAEVISDLTKLPFISAPNKFEALAANDAIVRTHSALKGIAITLNKISNDIRFLASGPRSGIGEISLPANEPGSSIMPGKVNPTQSEALTMVCAQIIGNDTSISFGATQGHFQLNVFKPMIASNLIESCKLLADACNSFNNNCLKGIKANKEVIKEKLNNSLMLVTALNPKIGYYKAAEIANKAHENGTTLKEEAVKLGYVSSEEYDEWVKPENMI